MKKFMDWMERVMAPKMSKINNNLLIKTMKDSMMQVLPLILAGSFITVIMILQDFIPQMPDMWSISSFTIGIVGLVVAFLIPFNYMENKKIRNLRLVAGMTGLGLYAMIVHLNDPELFSFDSLGAGGMFVAIIVGILSALVFAAFKKFSFFKADSSMPDFVRQWFDNLVPVLLLFIGTWLIIYIFKMDIFTIINYAITPLTAFAETLFGFTFIYFLYCFLYSMGISTWMMYSVHQPIMLAAIVANTAAVAAGGIASNLNTQEVIFSGWIAVGGVGGTLFLCIIMLFAKSKRLKAIGRASIVPSILNINEPIVFGAVAWNPILMIPMWIHGIVTPIIVFLWLKLGLAAVPYNLFGFWYCPFPFATWFVSRGLGAIILLLIVSAVNVVIYYPFYKIYDKQQVALEAESKKA